MKEYYTVYETGKFEFHVDLSLIIFIIMLVAFSYVVIHNFKYKTTLSGESFRKDVLVERFLSMIGLIITFSIFLIFIVVNVIDYSFIKKSYHNNDYSVVEGVIENFIPMKIDGHSQESFIVNEIEFSYNRSNPTYGYHLPKIDGGHITSNGQYVRISYITYNNQNIIIKLELVKYNSYN